MSVGLDGVLFCVFVLYMLDIIGLNLYYLLKKWKKWWYYFYRKMYELFEDNFWFLKFCEYYYIRKMYWRIK